VWLKRFGKLSTAFASGWMRVRGMRRRTALDRGFALSDHADWPALLETIAATGAERILVTHGYSDVLVRYLCSQGVEAFTMETQFQGESEEAVESVNIEESADAAAMIAGRAEVMGAGGSDASDAGDGALGVRVDESSKESA